MAKAALSLPRLSRAAELLQDRDGVVKGGFESSGAGWNEVRVMGTTTFDLRALVVGLAKIPAFQGSFDGRGSGIVEIVDSEQYMA